MNTGKIMLDVNKICRACMTVEGEMMSIYKKIDSEDIRIIDILQICCTLPIEDGDGLPMQICMVCYSMVLQTFSFKNQCHKSDSLIRLYMKEDNKDILKYEKIEDSMDTCPEEIITQEIVANFDHFGEITKVNVIEGTKIDIIDYDVNMTCECNICDQTFMTSQELEEHSITCNKNVNLLSCSKCSKTFKYQETLEVHYLHCRTHECCVCNKNFKTVGYLHNHMKKHDPTYMPPQERRFKCSQCDKAYTTPANLTIHQYSHTGIKPFKCEYCSRGFTKLVALNSHLAIHTGERAHLCSECGRGFTSSSILNQHKKIHSGERPFKCTYCGKSFTASGDLTIHMRSHTGEKPYLCPTCGRSFARITHLNTHIRTHTGERPYVCRECGRGFAQSGDLRSHMRTHTGERPYVCTVCNKSFIQSSGLSSHMATHTGLKSHVCNICNRGFSQASSLARHVKAHA